MRTFAALTLKDAGSPYLIYPSIYPPLQEIDWPKWKFLLNIFEDPRYRRGIGQVQLRNLASAASVDDAADSTIEVPDNGTRITVLAEEFVVQGDNNPLLNTPGLAVDLGTQDTLDLVADTLRQPRSPAALSYEDWLGILCIPSCKGATKSYLLACGLPDR